jgi:hypothetical protein
MDSSHQPSAYLKIVTKANTQLILTVPVSDPRSVCVSQFVPEGDINGEDSIEYFSPVIVIVLAAISGHAQATTDFTPEELSRRTVERRAVDAVIWGLPLVGFDAVKEAYFRDEKRTTTTLSGGRRAVAGRISRPRPT